MKQRGYTLIELIIVTAIISLPAGLAVPRLLRAEDRAAVLKARLDLLQIENAVVACSISQRPGLPEISVEQLAADGFLPVGLNPHEKLAGLKSSGPYRIDGSGRAYVLLAGLGKAVQFYRDTDLSECKKVLPAD